MQFRRAFFWSTEFTTHHGLCSVSVASNIASFAREYSFHRMRVSMSIGLSFHRFIGSLIRSWNRFSCSSALTENQYLISRMPELVSISSNSGAVRRYS